MNDELRLELERYLDGELPADRHASCDRRLSEDDEARRYLAQLDGLRVLARRHALTSSNDVSHRSQPRRLGPWAIRSAVAAACAVAVLVGITNLIGHAPTVPNSVMLSSRIQSRSKSDLAIQTREITFYTWANTAERRPEPVASALLLARSRSGKRSPKVEILALELANAPDIVAAKLGPLAMVHKSLPGGRSRSERQGRHIH